MDKYDVAIRARETRLKRTGARSRRGAVVVLAAILMVVMVAVLAFSIDLGYIATARTEIHRAVDAAALAGAGSLVDGQMAAEDAALEVFSANPIGGKALKDRTSGAENVVFETEVGHWNPASRTFVPSTDLPSAIKVSAMQRGLPLFFGRIFDRQEFQVQSEAIARYLPRDIILTLDFSASMNDDSELRRISEFGQGERSTIESGLLRIYQDLGSPVYGTMQFTPQLITSTNVNTIKQTLGLRYKNKNKWVETPYPYPSGSWDAYIDYVRTSSYLNSAGYRNKYGYMTLINYWLEQQPKYNQTPDLWKVSAQPVQAVKDAVTIFMNYIQAVDCEDHVSLVIYNSPSQTALTEHALTADVDEVADTINRRQAGHYDQMTNIGAGIREARLELDRNARIGAFKMIVLMTDGQANLPSNTTRARQYTIEQAELAAQSGYPVVTISLGHAADKSLMQQVADITKGVHFNIDAGQNVEDYEEELLEVFRQIADDRPLILVQ